MLALSADAWTFPHTVRWRTYPRTLENERTMEENLNGKTRAESSKPPRCENCNGNIGHGETRREEVDEHGQLHVRHDTVCLYFDECVDGVRSRLRKMGFCIANRLPKGTKDTEWLAEAGKNGWTVITQDARITVNEIERRALIDNGVKCFIMPTQPRNAWDMVRDFVMMWPKIAAESLFPGPFIWKLNEETSPVRWQQVYPEDRGHIPTIGLSRTPVGHLLNLFADVVHQHDEGWISLCFVQALHDQIRREIEARIIGDTSGEAHPDSDMEQVFNVPFDFDGGDSNLTIDLDQPMDLGEIRYLVSRVSIYDPLHLAGEYQWIIPAHKAKLHWKDQDFKFVTAPTGFHRSGFGLKSS